MKKIDIDYDLSIDYKLIFEDWNVILSNLFSSVYMYNLMVFLNELYKSNTSIQPASKKEVFEVFPKISWQDVRVVIVGGSPITTPSGGGTLFTSKDSLSCSRVTKQVQQCIERSIYGGLNLEFDWSLNHWLKQGVLPIHSALTTEAMKTNSHTEIWKQFTRSVITGLNVNRTGLIFLFIGEEARYFKQYVNTRVHTVLEYHHPDVNIKTFTDWNCPMFAKINSIIEKTNGKECKIKW